MSTKHTPDVDVVVTLAEDHISRIKTVAKRLTTQGLSINEVLETSGLITGSMQPDKIERLRKTKGVMALELSGDVQIAPPDSSIQ
jgi:hypothetical protein